MSDVLKRGKSPLTALAAVAIIVSACGGATSSPTAAVTPTAAATSAATAAATAAASTAAPDEYTSAKINWKQFAGQTLVLGAEEHPWTSAITPLLPQFEALTGIKVTLDTASETEYTTKMPVSLAGGAATPDVFMVWSMGQAVDAKWLEPLDSYYANAALYDAAWYDKNDVFTSAQQFPVWPADGVTYAMAITAEAQTMFYRQDLLTAKGLAVPKTMDDLRAVADALKTSSMSGIAMRAKPTGDAVPWTAAGWIFSNGGQIIDESGKAAFDSAEAVAAVDAYGSLLKADGPKGIGNYHWQEALGDFQQGKTAISGDSSNFAPDIENPAKSTVAGKVVYGALPSFGSKPAKPNMWHWLMGMNSKSANKGAAFLLMEWLTSKPTSILIGRNGAAPTRASAWQDAGFRAKFGATAADAALANLKAADGAVMTRTWFNPKSPQVLDLLAVAINKVIIGQSDAQAALTDAAAQANVILGK
jgi:multiple sugar transport system substrate-binding protein